ncbi:MAG: recombinase RecA [Spirochaetaceae bacterium]|jgi:recombination protein RecA|nr:recombinase RecA [Spirochaetaceae bacterium]
MAKTSESEKTRGNPLATGEEKAKALEAARLQIEKQFGAGSLMKLGAHANASGIEVIPSGSIMLDEALGIGGYPRGRIIEIYGPESSGKTTLALHAIAEAQKLGGVAAFVDAEHALDPIYAKNLGVNIDDLWVSQPDTGEQALEISESLVRSGAVDVIVVDSVAALTPQAEIEGDMGDAHVGLQARLMSQALRKLTAIMGKSRTVLVFINQIRMKIGIAYGNPETTTGGNALKFYASVRLDVRRVETIEKGDSNAVGNRVKVKVSKNKVAPPFRKVELEIMFGKGVSAMGGILDAAVKYNLIDKKGAWYSYEEEKIGQGRDNVIGFLEGRPELVMEFEEKLRQIMFPGREFPQKDKKTPGKAKSAGVSDPAAPSGASMPVPPAPVGAEPVSEARGSPGAKLASEGSAAGRGASKAAASRTPQPAGVPPVGSQNGAENAVHPKGAPASEPRHVGRPRKNPDPSSGLF